MKKAIIIVLCLFVSLYVMGIVTTKSDNVIKNIEGDVTSKEEKKAEGKYTEDGLWTRRETSLQEVSALNRAFIACGHATEKSVLDSGAEFILDGFYYAGIRDNGYYIVEIFFLTHNTFNEKINAIMRCAVEDNGDNARVVEMSQLTNVEERIKEKNNLTAKEILKQKCGRDWNVMYTDETGCRYF